MRISETGQEKSDTAQSLINDIGHVLDDMALSSSQQYACENCGSPVDRIPLIFFMSGRDGAWNVSLPVCLKCERKPSDPIRKVA